MADIFIRVNGTGNAWPVPLGDDHPFYDRNNFRELANVSFSIIKSETASLTKESVEWEILIDAGHGIIQYLIQSCNRLPDAVILTHAHVDHTLSLDWIIQSYYKHHKKQKLFPVYTSKPSWESVGIGFPQITGLSDFRELKPGVSLSLAEAPGLTLTSFPVYHGERAKSPSMLLIEYEIEPHNTIKAVFTGDILCPLLRRVDYRLISGSRFLFADANNRYPYVRSNHWSIISEGPDHEKESKYLTDWRNRFSATCLLAPHLPVNKDDIIHPYFDEFLAYVDNQIPLSVFEFLKTARFEKVVMIHYGGIEDRDYNGQDILNPVQLENWANVQAELKGIKSQFIVPKVGDLFELS